MAEKTLNTPNSEVKWGLPDDIKMVGCCDMFQLLCKASSQAEGWMKSTKALDIQGGGGCVVQVTTQQRNSDDSYAVAEALTFVPGVHLEGDRGRTVKLVKD